MVVQYLVELIGKFAETAGCCGLQLAQFAILFEFVSIVIDVAGHGQIVIQTYSHITATMFAEDCITVRVDVLRIFESKFKHRCDGVFESVGTDEVACFRHLLDGQERGVDTTSVGGFVLLLDNRKQTLSAFLSV